MNPKLSTVYGTDEALQQLLRNWTSVNAMLPDLPEERVVRAIAVELRTKCRVYMLQRLHQRASRLRARREWAALLQQTKEG